MRKYIISIFTFTLLIVMAVMVNLFTSVDTHAAGGAVAAIVTCDNDVFGFGGNTDPTVERAQVSINDESCECTGNNPDWPNPAALDCDNSGTSENEDDRCAECLASLVRAGMSLISSSAIYDFARYEQNPQHFLTGPSGPFLTRVGCFCD